MLDSRSELDSILDTEYRALLSGDYATLVKLSPRKFKLLETETVLADLAQRPQLRRKVGRNQSLLAMAIHGFRSARNNIEMIKGQRGGFRTYDKNGDQNHVGAAPKGFERKV